MALSGSEVAFAGRHKSIYPPPLFGEMVDGDAGRFDASRQLSSTLKTPAVSCRSWLVSDAVTGRPLLWHRPLERLQPASITKVVTALVVLDYIEKQGKTAGKGAKAAKTTKNCAAREQKTKLLETACSVSRYGASFAGWMAGYGWNAGTNAQLKAHESYTVRELLYAMMLPSGNDAAVTLARHFGPLVSNHDPAAALADGELLDEDALEQASIELFVGEMNRTAATLGCADTFFKSAHGMADDDNLSCVSDIITFSLAAMRHPLFAKVVRTIKFKCEAHKGLGREKAKLWTNTNVLLRSALSVRYDGVKTGWVPRAHGCENQQREWGCLVTRVARRGSGGTDGSGEARGGTHRIALREGFKIMVACVGSASQDERSVSCAWNWRSLLQMM